VEQIEKLSFLNLEVCDMDERSLSFIVVEAVGQHMDFSTIHYSLL
jgi:hypothetical protein